MSNEPAKKKFSAGQILFRAGDDCSGFVTVHSGTIRVTLTTASGKEIVLYRVHAGEICLQTFNCITQNAPYAAEGIAETDIEISILPAAHFDSLIQTNSDFRNQIYASIAGRFSDFEHIVQALAFSGLDIRVADGILRLANSEDELRITQEQLAHEVGSAREAISRQLGQFSKDNLIKVSRGKIQILNRTMLQKIASFES